MDNSENRKSGGHLVMYSDGMGNTVIYWKCGNGCREFTEND